MMLDRTGSMSSGDLDDEEEAADALVALYASVLPPLPKPALGVGSFGGLNGSNASVPTLGQLTTVYNNLLTAIAQMMSGNSSVGTNLFEAIQVGNAELNGPRHDPAKEKVLILISDGDPSEPSGSSNASTPYQAPTANAQNASGDLWNNPQNAQTDAGGDASDIVSENDRHRYQNFDFSVPSVGNISGIELQADAWVTGGGGSVTTLLNDGFGTGSTDSTFNEAPAWTEGGSNGAEKKSISR